MFLWSNSIFAEGIKIIVAPESKVEGGVITLGQLADVSGDDVEWVRSLRQLKLGSAPPLGSSTVLSKELLNMRLRATGSDFSGIVWQIPESVTVTTNSQVVNGQALLDKAVATIEQQIGHGVSSEDYNITPVTGVQDVIIPAGTMMLSADVPYGVRYNTTTNVTVSISVNGQLFSKVALNFNVKLYGQVVVVNRQVSFGEILTTDNVRYERLETGRLGAGYFKDMNKVLGLAARRSLPPGMVVLDTNVNKPLLIKQGNMVNIVAYIGSMEVSATGQAMQDGSEGQLIRVKNINSNKIMSAKVLNESTVQVLTYQSNGN